MQRFGNPDMVALPLASRPVDRPSLRTFLAELPEDEVFHISDPLELDFLPTALVFELEKRRRTPVVIIDRPKGFDVPVVANLFASRDRIARMVGAPPGGFNEVWVRALANLMPPTVVSRGPVHEVVVQGNEVDAGTLPISRHFEKDAGRYIGSGILICKDPDTGVRNLSYQRLQLKGPNRFGASLHSRGHIWDHLLRCEARGRNLEVAVVMGVHPTINLAAGAKVWLSLRETVALSDRLGTHGQAP
jgi:2,5-furandicarboxylate decarboxylase 1